jgi:hypothetical protein
MSSFEYTQKDYEESLKVFDMEDDGLANITDIDRALKTYSAEEMSQEQREDFISLHKQKKNPQNSGTDFQKEPSDKLNI